MYISLGSDCCTRKRLDVHLHLEQPTLFFDWILSDIDSVLYILDEQKEMNIDQFRTDGVTGDGNWIVTHVSYNIISLHDVSSSVEEKLAIQIVFEKLNRRRNRLLEMIKTQEDISFIAIFDRSNIVNPGRITVNDYDVLRLVTKIGEIRGNFRFKLFMLCEKYEQMIHISNVKHFNLETYNVGDHKDWWRNHLDWNRIFYEINNQR